MRKYRRPHRIKRKKSMLGKAFKSKFFWFLILLLTLTGAGFYFFLFSDFFQLKEIIVTGGKKDLISEFKEIVTRGSEKKILFFETKSIFLADLKKVHEEVLEKFPQIAKIQFRRRFPNIIFAQIEERSPLAVFCQEEKCFLTDKEGIIFEEIKEREAVFSQLIKIKSARPLQQQILKPGIKVISKEELAVILDLNLKIKENLNIRLKEFIIEPGDRLTAIVGEGWKVYFNLQGDIKWQLTKLAVILQKEEISPEQRAKLEYIDLRFGNLAIPKYQD